MGIVYRAYDRLDETRVALKEVQVDIDNLLVPSQYAPPSREMKWVAIAKEFQTLASLRHPNIVSVIDYGFDNQRSPFFTMEYLHNAQSLVEACQGKSITVKVQYLIQILQALAYLHRRGLLHRDLKPDNVLIQDQTVRLVDFGLSVAAEKASGIEGTLAYMAPEVIMTGRAVHESELYAVGVMAYELFAGQLPYDPLKLDESLLKIPDFSILDIPEPLKLVIIRLLNKIPADRYPNAFTVIEALQDAIQLPPATEEYSIRESYLQAASFVGREDEFRQLETALQDALAGKGSSWLVGGESGIGKSRLIDEIATYAMVNGALVLKGQAVEGGGVPYQLWHDVIRRLALFLPLEDAEVSILIEVLPDLDKRLQRTLPPTPKLSAQDRQEQLTLTIQSLFRRCTQPVVLLFEDLQWALESLTPLKSLIRIVPELRLLVIGTYRNDETPNLPQALPDIQHITLLPLDHSGVAELSVSMLGEIGQQPHFLEFIQRETEGNIFFLVEVVRALAEEAGRLVDVGRVTLPAQVIAGGIRQIVNRRLSRVPEWGQPLLKLAAIQGRQLDLPVLVQTGVLHWHTLERWLLACSEAAVLEVQEGRWRFRHDKLRETLLLDLTNQPALFKQVAEAMEAVYADHLNPHALALAQHWRAAGNTEKERHYTYIAAEQAFENCSYRESLELYRRVAYIDSSPPTETPRKEDAILHYKLGCVLQQLDEYDIARDHQNKALAIYTALEDAAGINEIIAQLGDIEVRQGNFAKARQHLEQSLALAEQRGDQKRIAYDLMTLGNLEGFEEQQQRALEIRQRSYQLMREVGDPIDIARALNNLAISHDIQGNKSYALELHQQALDIRRRLNDRRGIAYSLINMAGIAFDLEDFDRAIPLLDECLSLFQEIGQRSGVATAYNIQGHIAFKQGDHKKARHLITESLKLRRQSGDQHGVAGDLSDLARFAYESGELYTALHEYGRALEIRAAMDIAPLTARLLNRIANVYVDMEQFAPALTLLAFLKQMENLPDSIKDLDQRVADLRGHLDDEAAAKAEQAGQSATMDAIIKTTQARIQSILNP